MDVLLVHDMVVIHNVMASYPETDAPGCKKSDYGPWGTFYRHLWNVSGITGTNIDPHRSVEQWQRDAPLSCRAQRLAGGKHRGKQSSYP